MMHIARYRQYLSVWVVDCAPLRLYVCCALNHPLANRALSCSIFITTTPPVVRHRHKQYFMVLLLKWVARLSTFGDPTLHPVPHAFHDRTCFSYRVYTNACGINDRMKEWIVALDTFPRIQNHQQMGVQIPKTPILVKRVRGFSHSVPNRKPRDEHQT